MSSIASLNLLLKQIEDPSELSWREETYDLALAGDLDATDRDTFISRLIDAARADDPRAVLTLGYIGAKETLPAVLALAKAQNPMAATARRAVVLLGHGDEVIDQIAHDAVHSPRRMERVAAVMDLPKVGGALALDALVEALGDEDTAVRDLAWDGLVKLFDLDKHLHPDGKKGLSTYLELYSVWLGSDIAALRKMGLDAMRETFAKLRAGATPESLGIVWVEVPDDTFQAIRNVLFDTAAPYPLDELKPLTGSLRQWAETIILLRLESQDPRVADAMVRLGAEWTIPVLEEVAQSTPELHDSLVEAVQALRAS